MFHKGLLFALMAGRSPAFHLLLLSVPKKVQSQAKSTKTHFQINNLNTNAHASPSERSQELYDLGFSRLSTAPIHQAVNRFKKWSASDFQALLTTEQFIFYCLSPRSKARTLLEHTIALWAFQCHLWVLSRSAYASLGRWVLGLWRSPPWLPGNPIPLIVKCK